MKKKKMTKYAMIPINCKYDEEDRIHVRRVLISYKRRKVTSKEFFGNVYDHVEYRGTKLEAIDPYFLSSKRTHTYEFKDRYYRLVKVDNRNTNKIIYNAFKELYGKRKYKGNIFSHNKGRPSVIEFECDNWFDAVTKFNNREELK